jgi:hypothetical protein
MSQDEDEHSDTTRHIGRRRKFKNNTALNEKTVWGSSGVEGRVPDARIETDGIPLLSKSVRNTVCSYYRHN